MTSTNPKNLITPERFDIVAKYIYAKYQSKSIESIWHERLYLEHIRIFNGYVEADGKGKYGGKGFINSFNETIASICEDGFNSEISKIPINSDNIIVDGAHRIAASICCSSLVDTEIFGESEVNYNASYFKSNGLAEKWLDVIAMEYCQLKENTFIVIIYPAAEGKADEQLVLLNKYGSIVYRKLIDVKHNGGINLIKSIYHDEPWLGNNHNQFCGAQDKANYCFSNKNPLLVYLYESNHSNILKLKKEIRELYGIGNHSVHINDTHQETLWLSKIFFNQNTVDFMNYSSIKKNMWFDKLFCEYKEWLKREKNDNCEYCIDGGGVLAIYGIRNSRDLDYITTSDKNSKSGYKEISSHNNESVYFGSSLDDVIYNPDMHFYFNGYKVITLDVLKNFKKNRAEPKDLEDLNLINEFLSRKPSNTFELRKNNIINKLKISNIKTEFRLIALKCRFIIYMTYYKTKKYLSN